MDEDMILPDDFVSLPADEPTPEAQEQPVEEMDTETVDEPTRETADPVQTEQEPPATEPQKIKVKVDREEREITVEEAALLAQKGMNYERAVERAKQESAQQARDAFIAEQGMQDYDGKPITTEARYREVMQEKEIREKYKDLPEELRNELLESRRDREERKHEKAEQEKQNKQQVEVQEFIETFQSLNDRSFDANKDIIPQEVWDAVQKGQPLKYAYMEHHNRELRNQLKIAKQNENNIKKAPVTSVTSGGGIKNDPEDLFLKGFNSI